MLRPIHLILLLAATFALAAGAPAQKLFQPEKFDRATKKDENGKVQWADHAEVKCPNCQGAGKHKCTTCERYPEEATKCPDCQRKEPRESVCHTCAGTGKFPDPLEEVLCPGCMGAGHIVCGFCPGSGILRLGEGAKRWSNCPGCGGDGVSPCQVCKGKRLIEAIKLKPTLAEADAATVKKALEQTADLLRQVQEFEPVGKNIRKELKVFEKALKNGEKTYPAFKLLPKQLDDLMKTVFASSGFQGQQEREIEAAKRTKSGVEYYLQHQKHMLELALKRAEENEKGAEH